MFFNKVFFFLVDGVCFFKQKSKKNIYLKKYFLTNESFILFQFIFSLSTTQHYLGG